jgi:hypothetical protein
MMCPISNTLWKELFRHFPSMHFLMLLLICLGSQTQCGFPPSSILAAGILGLLQQGPTSTKRAPPPDPAFGRDLSVYEKSNFSISFGWLPRDDLSQLFRFLWIHWRQKHKAYATLTVFGIDTGTSFHFFVEPDTKEHWRISITRQHYEVLSVHVYPVTSLPEAYQVKKVAFSPQERSRLQLTNQDYKLELKDVSGIVITPFGDLTKAVFLEE